MLAGGLRLSLLIGPLVPLPAPRAVLDALDSVQISSAAGEASGFQLSFRFSARSPLNTIFLLAAARGSGIGVPPLRVILAVALGAQNFPLFDGVMTRAEVQPGSGGESGTLTVTGEDLSRIMDMQDMSGLPFPAMPVEARVALLCAKYAPFGLIPLVVPALFSEVPLPTERIPAQRGTDLGYLRELAAQLGYVFYVEPGPAVGTNIAYFGPEIKTGPPQPALNVDMGPLSNVESLSFSFDPTRGVLPVVLIQNPQTRLPIPVPIPRLNPLQPPLGLLPTPLSSLKLIKDTARMTPIQALSRGLAEAGRSQDSVSASGSLDVLRYGRPLKARSLVGVRGVGIAYDGLYYVKRVSSTLKRGEFRQSFQLSRNGLVPTIPGVRP